MNLRYLFPLLTLFFWLSVNAGNPIFNAGFELTDAGYKCVRYLRPDRNPELKFIRPELSSSSHSGSGCSLKIPNPFAEAVEFSSEEFKLKPNQKYCFSLWMRSSAKDYPVRISVVSVKSKWCPLVNKGATLTEKWKRYSFAFKTSADKKFDYYHVRILFGKKDCPADIYFDDFQINSGSQPANESREYDIEGIVDCSRVYVKNNDSSKNKVSVRLINHSSKSVKDNYKLEIQNKYTKKKVLSKTLRHELLPGKAVEIKLDLSKDLAFGVYTVKLLAAGKCKAKFIPGQFAVIGRYKSGSIDLDRDFCVSLNQSVEVSPPSWVPGVFATDEIAEGAKTSFGVNEEYELLEKMGCRLVRLWSPGAVRWAKMEAEQGKFDFSPLELELAIARKHNMKILPVLGCMDFLDPRRPRVYGLGSLPDWLKKKSRIEKKFPLKHKYRNGVVYLPPMDLWRKYLSAAAHHFKGRISHYEIMNEPNLIFKNSSEYVQYLEGAWEVLKGVDKDSKVIGLCVTGDLGGAPTSFLGSCLKLGALKYCDIVSFHPYNARDLSSTVRADNQINEMKNLCKNFGGKAYPLWNTELYYLHGRDSQNFAATRCEPYHVARRFLTDLGEGLGQSITLPASIIWESMTLENQLNQSVKNGDCPSGAYVVYNALARHFEGATAVAKIRWKPDCICYVYKRRGKYIAAFWSYGELRGLELKLNLSGMQTELYDIFGNPVKVAGDSLNIGFSPLYIMLKGAFDKEKFIAAMKSAKVSMGQPVAASGNAKLYSDGDQKYIAVGLKNCSGEALNCRVVLNRDERVLKMNGYEQKTVCFPVTYKVPRKVTLKVLCKGNEQRFPIKIAEESPVYVIPADGEGNFIQLVNAKGKKDPDFKAEYKVAVKGDDLVFTFKVNDSSDSGISPKRKYWEKDGIELFFDVAPFTIPLKYGIKDQRKFTGRAFIIPNKNTANNLVIWNCPSSKEFRYKYLKCSIKKDGNGYQAELKVALKALKLQKPLAGKSFGLGLKVNNAPASGKTESSLLWSKTDKLHKHRYSFGIIKFQ